ncbi:hypothetical protein bmyco0003_26680 [Bacillus pseudomycoides]|nr:hypothetical protein bmyco0002_25270 [Bacillus pseudomycoides]EEM10583.1 hypothetical protein bmyco0003_26680 [Bacillus pseudomycoides]
MLSPNFEVGVLLPTNSGIKEEYIMNKNARGYVQDSYHSLHEAKQSLEHALQTVEKSDNRERIEQSLQAVEHALQKCDHAVHILEQE